MQFADRLKVLLGSQMMQIVQLQAQLDEAQAKIKALELEKVPASAPSDG